MTEPRVKPISHPTYVSGRRYWLVPTLTTNTVAVGALDTALYLIPFQIRAPGCRMGQLGARVATGASAGGICKIGLWRHDWLACKPTGTPIAAIANGADLPTTVSSSDVNLEGLSLHLDRDEYYWAGFAFSVAAPQLISIAQGAGELGCTFGKDGAATFNTSITGYYWAGFAYSMDLRSLDLSNITLNDIAGNGGVPLPFMTVK